MFIFAYAIKKLKRFILYIEESKRVNFLLFECNSDRLVNIHLILHRFRIYCISSKNDTRKEYKIYFNIIFEKKKSFQLRNNYY